MGAGDGRLGRILRQCPPPAGSASPFFPASPFSPATGMRRPGGLSDWEFGRAVGDDTKERIGEGSAGRDSCATSFLLNQTPQGLKQRKHHAPPLPAHGFSRALHGEHHSIPFPTESIADLGCAANCLFRGGRRFRRRGAKQRLSAVQVVGGEAEAIDDLKEAAAANQAESAVMSSPSAWLFSDNSRYSTRARLLFMGLSFAIGILTFLLYLALWYICSTTRRRRRNQQRLQRRAAVAAAALDEGGDRGMSADAIAALPTFVVVPIDDGDSNQQAALDCPVCLGQVEAGEKARRLPKCGHAFHAECVDAWLRAHSTCPMCRAAVGTAAAATATKVQAPAAADVTTTPAPAPAAAEALPPV